MSRTGSIGTGKGFRRVDFGKQLLNHQFRLRVRALARVVETDPSALIDQEDPGREAIVVGLRNTRITVHGDRKGKPQPRHAREDILRVHGEIVIGASGHR